jgi:hypothetical protein
LKLKLAFSIGYRIAAGEKEIYNSSRQPPAASLRSSFKIDFLFRQRE